MQMVVVGERDEMGGRNKKVESDPFTTENEKIRNACLVDDFIKIDS